MRVLLRLCRHNCPNATFVLFGFVIADLGQNSKQIVVKVAANEMMQLGLRCGISDSIPVSKSEDLQHSI
jgi:hypothetical protein